MDWASCASCVITGTMGCTPGLISNPAAVILARKYLVFSFSLSRRSPALLSMSKTLIAAATTCGGSELENRYGCERCRDCFYEERRTWKRVPFEDRFWAKVEKRGPEECWPWIGGCNPQGYGRLQDANRENSVVLAHRASYELAFGISPGDECVLHRCDNPPCVNPAHLWLGTKAENNRDMGDKGRAVVPGLKGENHPNAWLTDTKVLEMLGLVREGWLQADVARAYGVDRGNLWAMVKGKSWKHLHKSSERVDGLSP